MSTSASKIMTVVNDLVFPGHLDTTLGRLDFLKEVLLFRQDRESPEMVSWADSILSDCARNDELSDEYLKTEGFCVSSIGELVKLYLVSDGRWVVFGMTFDEIAELAQHIDRSIENDKADVFEWLRKFDQEFNSHKSWFQVVLLVVLILILVGTVIYTLL